MVNAWKSDASGPFPLVPKQVGRNRDMGAVGAIAVADNASRCHSGLQRRSASQLSRAMAEEHNTGQGQRGGRAGQINTILLRWRCFISAYIHSSSNSDLRSLARHWLALLSSPTRFLIGIYRIMTPRRDPSSKGYLFKCKKVLTKQAQFSSPNGELWSVPTLLTRVVSPNMWGWTYSVHRQASTPSRG
jgi:hypothetical protein